MRLGWSERDEPEPAQVREIRRNTGQLLGRLVELLPCPKGVRASPHLRTCGSMHEGVGAVYL